MIKDLERWSLSWIIRVGPNSDRICPYKNKAQGIWREMLRRGRDRLE